MFPEERWVAPSSLVLHDEGVAGDVAEENEEDVDPTLCVEGIVLNMFDRVCVRVSLDSSNLQHQRIRMHLVRPEIPGYNPAESTPWGSPSPRPKKPRQH
ncbi:exosome complex exonuclease RRP44-like [Petromyzon marinus]